MAGTLVPKLGVQLKPLGIGEKCTYRFNLTDIVGPDPATWTGIYFKVGHEIDDLFFTVPIADMTVTPSGTAGDYSVIIDAPVTVAQSQEVEVGTGLQKAWLTFVSPTARGLLVGGLIPVFEFPQD